MKRNSILMWAASLVVAVALFAAPAWAGMEDRGSYITLRTNPYNFILGPELAAAPEGNPAPGWWRLYGRTNSLYFEADDGTTTNLVTATATGMASIEFTSGSVIHYDTVTLTSAQVLTLNATPVELIATPGVSAFIEVVSVGLILDYGGTNVFTVGAGSDLVVEYGTSNDDITGSIETDGLLTVDVDQIATYFPTSPQASNALSDLTNNNVQLYNAGAEIAGNAGDDNAIVVKIAYRIHPIP